MTSKSPPRPPHPDSLRCTLSATGAVVAISEHGLEIPLRDLAHLQSMLQALAKPKRVGINLSSHAPYILAEWERVCACGERVQPFMTHAQPDCPGWLGAGKVPKEPRKFQANGKPAMPTLAELGLV